MLHTEEKDPKVVGETFRAPEVEFARTLRVLALVNHVTKGIPATASMDPVTQTLKWMEPNQVACEGPAFTRNNQKQSSTIQRRERNSV